MSAVGTTFVSDFGRAGRYRWRIITEPALVANVGPERFVWAEPVERLNRRKCHPVRCPHVFYWPLTHRINGLVTEIVAKTD